MKSKLVKYPFNDGKRYRWDKYQMGKKFEYAWERTPLAKNYNTITPYIEAQQPNNTDLWNGDYAVLGEQPTPTYYISNYPSYTLNTWRLEYGKYKSNLNFTITDNTPVN